MNHFMTKISSQINDFNIVMKLEYSCPVGGILNYKHLFFWWKSTGNVYVKKYKMFKIFHMENSLLEMIPKECQPL